MVDDDDDAAMVLLLVSVFLLVLWCAGHSYAKNAYGRNGRFLFPVG